eukprot:SAG22_NODE_295_length_12850_cov_9.179202_11_plen_218_part_00
MASEDMTTNLGEYILEPPDSVSRVKVTVDERPFLSLPLRLVLVLVVVLVLVNLPYEYLKAHDLLPQPAPDRRRQQLHTIQCVEKATNKTWGDPALTSLTRLELGDNQITDIAPLSAFTSLTDLNLQWNHITDIAPLSALTSLDYLDLGVNRITDIAPLKSLTSLTLLDLMDNHITDIAPLKSLTSLRTLRLRNNPGEFSDSDETVVLLKSRGCSVQL